MEIGPIPGIRALPAVKTPPADPRLSAVFDIQNSSSAGDDTFSGSNKKTASGQDDEADELDEQTESATETRLDNPNSTIHFVA